MEHSARNAYAAVCKLLIRAREIGTIPWWAIIDPGRRYRGYYSWTLREYTEAKMGSAIKLDIWRGQPCKVEVWVEKDTMFQIVENLLYPYRVPIQINRGYSSSTINHGHAERYGTGKGWTLLYIGDFDPSGIDIDRALREGLKKYGARPNIVRVTLTQEDTVSLIPKGEELELKKSDPRRQRFIDLYGEDQQGFEIDSLPRPHLKEKLFTALSQYMDIPALGPVFDLEAKIDKVIADRLDGTLNDITDLFLKEGVPGCDLPLKEQHRYLLSKEEFEEEEEE